MEDNCPKYAVLAYAKEEQKPEKKSALRLFKKPVITYSAKKCEILGEKGLTVTLPITKDVSDDNFKNEVYINVLNKLSACGVIAVAAVKGEPYNYDGIIPAMSGFYVLPFFLPSIIKRVVKRIDNRNPELLIIGEMQDLTLDILCIISPEINNINVYTTQPTSYETAIEKFYADSGINIFVTDKEPVCENADIIVNASLSQNRLSGWYKKGSVYIDMAGHKKKTAEIAQKRPDMTVIDGIELKTDFGYISNALVETVLFANDESFRCYLNGYYSNDDFYSVYDKINGYGLKITAFKRFGENI